MTPNRPRGRQKHVTGTGKPINRAQASTHGVIRQAAQAAGRASAAEQADPAAAPSAPAEAGSPSAAAVAADSAS